MNIAMWSVPVEGSSRLGEAGGEEGGESAGGREATAAVGNRGAKNGFESGATLTGEREGDCEREEEESFGGSREEEDGEETASCVAR
jgi:hypothetical protein